MLNKREGLNLQMITWKTTISAIVFLSSLSIICKAQLISPCPRLFTYEARRWDDPDKWYGVITLSSDTELTGIWLKLQFSRPSLQLGDWFGEVTRLSGSDYLIKKPGFHLKPNIPQTIRFYIKYNVKEEVPILLGFQLNGKTVCPERFRVPTTTSAPALITSEDLSVPPPLALANQNPIETIEQPDDLDDPDDGPITAFDNQGGLLGSLNWPEDRVPSICGTVFVQSNHGKEAQEGQYPWHASLYHSKKIDLTYMCGLTLISEKYVVTVAHCVTHRKTGGPVNVDTLVVFLGKFYLRRWSHTGIQDRQVDKIIPHPDYNSKTHVNDIAMLKLIQPAEYTIYVRPICLWGEDTDIRNVINKAGTVVGWGFNEKGLFTEELTQTKMPVVALETCVYSYPELFSKFSNDKTFCADYTDDTSVCTGDSGGAMVFPKPGTNPPVWQLRGLVSLSVALQNQFKCDHEHYVVFTDVAKYLEWIRRTLNV